MQDSAQNVDDAVAREVERVVAREADADRLRALLASPGSFDHALWRLAVEQGWPGLAVPEALGGLGLGWRELADTVQVLGHATVSLPLIQCTLISRLLLKADNSDGLRVYGEKLASGEMIGCIALLEKGDAGLPPQPSLRLENGRVSGEVAQTPFAAVADCALVAARSGARTVFALVELNNDEVARRAVDLIDNARGAAALRFSGAAAVEIVLEEAPGAAREVLSLAAVLTAFEQIGGAQACLELAREYAMEHRAFGQPIGAFQAIKHKLADVYTGIEIGRGCALEALEELERDALSVEAAAAARIAANRAYDFAAQEAIQVHGGMGITWEAFLHHHFRRARSLALELGSTAYWRNQLLAQLQAAAGGDWS